MTLEEAINASMYDTAKCELSCISYVVDGTEIPGKWSIECGRPGMPHTIICMVSSLQGTIKVASDLKLPTEGWEPVQESQA